MGISIYGIQAAQAAMLRTANAVKPNSGLGAAVKEATVAAHRYAVYLTHVDTGALRAAHHMEITGRRGGIYIDPAAARSDGKRPSDYGPFEHARGESHAFYERTVEEYGRQILNEAGEAFRRYLP